MPELTYTCEVCGKDFISKRVRKGRLVCGPCASELRKKGQGVVQLAKAGPKAEVEPKAVEAGAERPRPVVVEGKTLDQLARELREKYAKKREQTIGEPIKEG